MSTWIDRRIEDGALILSGQRPFYTLSSSVLGGGLQEKRYLLNVQVPHGYTSDDPWQDLERKVEGLGIPLSESVGMMTAADVDQVVEGFAAGDQFQLRVYVTAGVGNAARAGMKRKTYPGYRAGTINIIVALDARLSDAALVNALITITEAKAAALQDLGVTDATGAMATGTTTDSVIVATTQNPAYTGVHLYAGLATELGNAIASSVYDALTASLQEGRAAHE
ncbi:adenosylcobinamide amidohydrolase [Tumebacillus permanentifrigoris]|uniref:Adenosylcobinamide amidohydrolase n=1 Tax=Tumebacillus permanentifrigoris TaxID=378543 RepID=A0A316DBS7_9BACL|nr:adenosylcobinamide amidohydrolase [Tumebacillus permanentifrigoris]PWK14819.1 adenosylcobinamide amidohydrolase [Tumebacillus permanentifrigoris]